MQDIAAIPAIGQEGDKRSRSEGNPYSLSVNLIEVDCDSDHQHRDETLPIETPEAMNTMNE